MLFLIIFLYFFYIDISFYELMYLYYNEVKKEIQ